MICGIPTDTLNTAEKPLQGRNRCRYREWARVDPGNEEVGHTEQHHTTGYKIGSWWEVVI